MIHQRGQKRGKKDPYKEASYSPSAANRERVSGHKNEAISDLASAIHNSLRLSKITQLTAIVDSRTQSISKFSDQRTQHNKRQSTDQSIQLARIPVGFDRVSAATDPVADSLVTRGLGNCIAIAAQDNRTGLAVMGHLNTNNTLENVDALIAFRTLLLNELERIVGRRPNPVFHVSLGTVWMSRDRDVDHPRNNRWWQMRHGLIVDCINVFGTEPSEFGDVAEFNLATGQIRGSGENGDEANLVARPADDPHGRAGDDIPYDRLRHGNVRGHKLDKNMGLMDRASVRLNPEG